MISTPIKKFVVLFDIFFNRIEELEYGTMFCLINMIWKIIN